jgi:hypothetical protein
MVVANEGLQEIVATVKLQTERLTAQIQQLMSNVHHRPLGFREIETRVQPRIDEVSSRLKQGLIEAQKTSLRIISKRLDEQHDRMAEAVWPRLQRTLALTDLICDWFMDDSHNRVVSGR